MNFDDMVEEVTDDIDDNDIDDKKENGHTIENEILGDKLAQYIVFDLRQGQTIVSYVSPMYIVGSVEINEINNTRNNETAFSTKSSAKIALGSPFPNSILEVEIQNEDNIYVHRANILASTDNVLFEKNTVKTKGDKSGYIWLSASGTSEKLDVKEGDSLTMNSGIFLISKTMPKVNENGNYVFKGPCVVSIQTKNNRQQQQQAIQVQPQAQSQAQPQAKSQPMKTQETQTQQQSKKWSEWSEWSLWNLFSNQQRGGGIKCESEIESEDDDVENKYSENIRSFLRNI